MSKQASGDGADVLLGTACDRPPLIPEGEYAGVFARAELGRYAGRERWFLWFAIMTPGDELGKKVYLSCPCPEGKEKVKAFGTGSKLIAAYAVANGKLPRRRDRISTKVFRGKVFRFVVRTVTRDSRGDERPAADHYSVIDHLIKAETGLCSEEA